MKARSLIVYSLLAIVGLGSTVLSSAQKRPTGGVQFTVVADENLRGKTAASRGSADLRANGWSDIISSHRRVASGNISSEPQSQDGASIDLFSQTNFRGNPRNFTAAVPSLTSSNRRVASVTIRSGVWQLCRGNHFTGRCVTLDQSVRDLSTLNMRNRVASLRPVVRRPQ